MHKPQHALIVLSCWLILVTTFMILAQRFDLEVFFVLWLIGLLVVVELIDTRFSQARYLKRIKVIIACGILIFSCIVIGKILEILNK